MEKAKLGVEAEGRGTGPPPASGGDIAVWRQITKTYGTVEAVSGVDLSIARGEFFTLLGPSGSGKTTLLHVLAGLIAPDLGHGGHRRQGRHRRAALPPQPRHGLPVAGAVPAHGRVLQRRLSAADAPHRARGDRAARDDLPRDGQAAGHGAPPRGRPERRSAPAHRAGPRARLRAAAAAARRAARSARPAAARGHAGRADAAAPRPRRDDRQRHARPARGLDAERPHRDHRERHRAPGRRRRSSSTASRPRRSSRSSSATLS